MTNPSKRLPRNRSCPNCTIGLQVEKNNGHKVLGCPKCGHMEPYEIDEKPPAPPAKPPGAERNP